MTARVTSIALARYVGPGRALARPHGLVLRLRTTAGVTGVGEAVVAGDRTEPAWQALREVAATLVGAEVGAWDPQAPGSGPDEVLQAVSGWRPAAATDRGPRRSAKFAAEMALLDLAARLAVHGGAAPAGAVVEPWQVAAVRLTGDTAHDAERVREAAAAERDGGHRPLWLAGGDRSPAAARQFVGWLAARVADGTIASDVYVAEPLARAEPSLLAKVWRRLPFPAPAQRSSLRTVQRAAAGAATVPSGRPGPSGSSGQSGARVRVVAGRDAASPAAAAGHAHAVDALLLSPARLGSLTAVAQAARAAKHRRPQVQVLVERERGSRITGAALATLCAATAEIDGLVPGDDRGVWPELLPEPVDDGPALPDVDLGELATVADELAELPETAEVLPGTAEPPNTFPEYPLTGTALAVRSMLLETEALRRGVATRRLARDFFLVCDADGAAVGGFADSESSRTTAAASEACADKGVTRALAERAGLPVPAGASFPAGAWDAAYEAGMRLGYPLVVKPAGGSKGTAVTTGIATAEQLAKAIDEVAACKYADTGVVVEQYVTGDDYRVLATRGEVLSVVRREPATVVGDGRRTVAELVLAANVARRRNPHLAKRPIVLDDRVDGHLADQRLTRDAVPEQGQRVLLRAEANLSLGGDSREVRDHIHPSLAELATAAVAAVPGLPYAGLDLLMADHRAPVAEQTVTLIEVNSRPVQSLHHFPMYGPPRNVSDALVCAELRAAGREPGDPADTLSVRLTVTGRLAGAGYERWLATAARQLGLAGWVAPHPPADGADTDGAGADGGDVVVALVHGPAPRVGLLARTAFHGPADTEVAQSYAEPVATVPPAGFRVRDRAERS